MEIEALLQQIQPGATTANEQLLQQLQQAVNYLIQNDFERLVRLLYTVDVDEKRLKTLLQQNEDTDAAVLISHLLVERQVQKIKTRQQFGNHPDNSDEEGW